jgi:hypothetical protein
MHINYKRYGLYLIRWQLSTPILAVVPIILHLNDFWTAAFIANIIGGLIFFWVDNFIFTAKELTTQWEVAENIICADCGKTARGYRIVKTLNYDKTKDTCPKFRCESCSVIKTEELRSNGIKV